MADPRLRGLRGPFALALALHIVLLALFALKFESSQQSVETPQPEIIEAVVLDDPRIAAEAERLKADVAPPAEMGAEPLPEPSEPVPTPNPEESRRAQQIEAERREAERRRIAEQKRLDAERREAEKAAEESRRQMEAKKLAEQTRKEEQKRKAEAAAK
ncbi:MAG: cell envelope integrity protein TolA, partial [Pseudomonadota bacterium]